MFGGLDEHDQPNNNLFWVSKCLIGDSETMMAVEKFKTVGRGP